MISKDIVFEDRYGCRCTFCERCVIKLQIEWDNNLRKRIRTHNDFFLRLPLSANREIEYHSDGIDPFDNNHYYYKCCDKKKTKFRDYLLINPHTGLRQIAVYNCENWKYCSEMKNRPDQPIRHHEFSADIFSIPTIDYGLSGVMASFGHVLSH